MHTDTTELRAQVFHNSSHLGAGEVTMRVSLRSMHQVTNGAGFTSAKWRITPTRQKNNEILLPDPRLSCWIWVSIRRNAPGQGRAQACLVAGTECSSAKATCTGAEVVVTSGPVVTRVIVAIGIIAAVRAIASLRLAPRGASPIVASATARAPVTARARIAIAGTPIIVRP